LENHVTIPSAIKRFHDLIFLHQYSCHIKNQNITLSTRRLFENNLKNLGMDLTASIKQLYNCDADISSVTTNTSSKVENTSYRRLSFIKCEETISNLVLTF